MTQSITGRAALLATTLVLAGAGVATAAFVGLPADGTQVNDDPAAGIDPHQDAGVSDVTGGSLAGAARVPWATFEQKSGDAQLIFVRAFQKGAWVTQGRALNIDPAVEAEAPSIDFAGARRTVPWDAWYEPSKALGGVKQIFASRFCAAPNAICPAGGTWVPEGQDRGGGTPSLNINTDREAENPSVAGGAAVAGNDPVPWVAWQEQGGKVSGQTRDQIFVSKGVKQAAPHAPCTGFKPSSAATVSSFCWQQVGADRLARDDGSSATGDPTLNVDPTRNGIEPDITFTGKSDIVAWTVWYETGPSALGLRGNEQVFAAKIVADTSAGVDGGFHWQAVGNGTASQVNPLDTSAGNKFGPCAASQGAEDACALNADPGRDAEDPRVATGTPTPGTLPPGTPTVPWVVWAEDAGSGRHGIFVSRLVGGTHFVLAAGGRPISNPGHDATTPDITFFRDTPYVSWVESVGSAKRGFVGHFEPTGAFTLDTPGGLRQAPGGRKVPHRLPRADLVELHVGPVHRRRHPVPGRGARCAVLRLHPRRRHAGALRAGCRTVRRDRRLHRDGDGERAGRDDPGGAGNAGARRHPGQAPLGPPPADGGQGPARTPAPGPAADPLEPPGPWPAARARALRRDAARLRPPPASGDRHLVAGRRPHPAVMLRGMRTRRPRRAGRHLTVRRAAGAQGPTKRSGRRAKSPAHSSVQKK